MIFVSQLNHSRFPCLAKGLFSFYHPLILPMSQIIYPLVGGNYLKALHLEAKRHISQAGIENY